MAVLLMGVKVKSANMRLLDYGGFLTPALGGASQRINRLGNRYAIDIEVPPLPEEPDGRLFTLLLEQALSQGAAFLVPQPSLQILPAGSPRVNGPTAGGTTLAIDGATPNYVVRAGQYLSIIHAGRRYLHRNLVETEADDVGNLTLAITPMLRTALADNDVVELEQPIIEGWIDAPTWGLMQEPFTSVKFSITEAA